MRERRIPTAPAGVIGVVVKRMRVAGHVRESGKMFFTERMRRRFENFANFEIVKVTLRHGGDPFILPPPLAGEGDRANARWKGQVSAPLRLASLATSLARGGG